MIFDALYESAQRGELLLLDGGFCHWHLRRDGQLTIREIIVTRQNEGLGRTIIARLSQTPGATSIAAKCPDDLAANGWYEHLGFTLEGTQTTRSGKTLNLWRLTLSTVPPATGDLPR